MPAAKRQSPKTKEAVSQDLQKLKTRGGATLSLADFIRDLAPEITEARESGVPAGAVYDLVAKRTGCSADLVQRYYRRAITGKTTD